MKYTNDKEINNIISQLLNLGWNIQKNRHIKCTSPNGKMVVISNSPSCPFTYKKILRYIKNVDVDTYSRMAV